MSTKELSRRDLIWSGAAAVAAATSLTGQDAPPALTVGAVIDRIKANVGVPWRTETVDKIVAGSADIPVKGIATTMMATLDVLQRSAAKGRNFVISHEPTFYMHQEKTEGLVGVATYEYKLKFIADNKMAVFHFHDHWHAHKPDGIATGMMKDLGWEKNVVDPQSPRAFSFPGVPLLQLVRDMQSRLKIRTMRVVGDPKLAVNHVAASWGYLSQEAGIHILSRPDVDVLVMGETREWEVVEFAQDMVSSGQKKAIVIMGHVVSEQSGMKYCADWLKGFVTEVPVEFVAATEPFGTPDAPLNS